MRQLQRHSFPFTYLGCPIFYSRRRKDFYKNIIFKVQEKLSSWKGFTRAIQAIEGQDNGLHGITYVFLKVREHVDEVVENGAWNAVLLRELLPDELADHILETITPPSDLSMKDKPWWKLETKGYFTVKSAWQYIRKRREESKLYKFFWVKGLPFRISFFMWRLLKAKLPLYDWFLRLGYFRTSRCWCCRNPKEETLPHVFLTSPFARYVWNYYGASVGIRTYGK
ncbi:uncharacterized protein [Nicotiana tomentosiformis]|uniref:uncharacterized protein n=1 Tax=Nicotiana tomentosiformis TaxID=4098 RepID=UPI00388CDD28